jgi:hypothetical protein
MMERIMSKIKDTSKVAALNDHRPLADSELELVSGGLIHEGTHVGGGQSVLVALATAMGKLMEQEFQRQQELR